MLQVAEAMAGISPFLQLSVEEARDAAVFHDIRLALHHLLAGHQFHGAQTVFVEIVGIHPVDAQGGIRIASPATAEIQLVVDSADAIAARESQSQGVVLAIAGVRELHLSYQWGKEGARCTQTVDTQGVVATVILGPFLMVDESRRQGIQVEIAHAIGTNHHRRLLVVEGIHDFLKGFRR